MKKKIVHITFSDDVGGAAIAAFRLHKAMLDYGLDSQMVVFEKKRKEEEISSICNSEWGMYFYKFKSYIIADRKFILDKNRGYYSSFDIGSNIKNNKIIMQADVIYLHWINRGLLNCKNIEFLLKEGKNIFWVMHDMFPITGGCHHSYECDGYQRNCRECPFKGVGKWDAYMQLKKKEKLKQYDNMHWIAPSRWLYECACKSVVIEKNRVYHIPNVISSNFFTVDKLFARKVVRLVPDKKYILYGADGVLKNPYKGLKYFVKALNLFYKKCCKMGMEKNIEIMLFGSEYNDEITKKIPFAVHFMGEIRDERTMNLLYNASDLFVVTSLAENYPLTIQEAIYCNIPVVAFNVGGIPDLLSSPEKGVLIDGLDTDKMANAIESIISRDNRVCIEKYTNDEDRCKIVEKYIEVLNNVES